MSSTTTTAIDRVDVRGPRFAAWVTTAVLLVTLLVSALSPLAAAIILGVQAVIFAIGALGGPRRHPYGKIFAALVAPRLGPVTEREPTPPLKFAQLVGLKPIGQHTKQHTAGQVRGRRPLEHSLPAIVQRFDIKVAQSRDLDVECVSVRLHGTDLDTRHGGQCRCGSALLVPFFAGCATCNPIDSDTVNLRRAELQLEPLADHPGEKATH